MAEKQLESTVAAGAFQKQWFADLRRKVFEERRPYALIQADVPFELFDLLGIPAVSNQWWSALVAAKRQAPAFSRCHERRWPAAASCAATAAWAWPPRVIVKPAKHPGADCRARACCARG